MNALDQFEGQQVTVRTLEGDFEGELISVGEDGIVVKETRLNSDVDRWESRLVFIERLGIHTVEGAWSV